MNTELVDYMGVPLELGQVVTYPGGGSNARLNIGVIYDIIIHTSQPPQSSAQGKIKVIRADWQYCDPATLNPKGIHISKASIDRIKKVLVVFDLNRIGAGQQKIIAEMKAQANDLIARGKNGI